jgi:2-hydroxychromene-2-carboxylate isomerase
VESRFFPLDGRCNPSIERASEDAVRCTAARALLCLEGDARAFEVTGRLYSRQESLTEDEVFALASEVRPRESLEACVRSPETDAKLRDDVAWALEHGITGTPLVLVNGRKGTAYPAFLVAIALAGGDPRHRGFAALPPPRDARAKGG